jgi:23S rRNA (cytosine1962-C5)-methyltransferase
LDRTDSQEGRWTCRRDLPERWTIRHGRLVFELKRNVFGHLGLFPEQAENWPWIAEHAASTTPLRVLNLFAYTGGSTLAAAAAGAEVAHVDAARNLVAWARRNAELSGLAEAPIRWIVEDAVKFVKREVRRGNAYDAVILDPPSYGHGAHGEVWRLSQHLPRLLELCARLTAGRRRFMLLTCHTPEFDPARLGEMMRTAMGDSTPGDVAARPLVIPTATGRELPSGVVVTWEAPDYSSRAGGPGRV